MKKLLFLFTLLLSFQSVIADCSAFGIQFYPMQEKINRNAMFIIQGYAMNIKTIKTFKNRKVYLKSESGELVELKLQEILYSQMNLAQAIFMPSKTLRSNTKYFLKYENQTDKETKDMQSRFYGDKKPLYWITSTEEYGKTFSTPVSATYKTSRVEYYGCGPEANAIFDVKNDPSKKTWYRTELLDVSTNTTSVYYIQSYNNKISVGHDMCSGAFSFNRKGMYKVRFTPINSDGKAARATNWITFKSPFAGNKLNGF
ncbi:hypothetical protein [uncultured Kordia sp.]|uniref:hypothetical protein n=1 Tax=uncultured Kordia sp. TaxID=507699 RepID=UPI00260AB57A|nr:hypothetical protein [uncultured Kordia sp.]